MKKLDRIQEEAEARRKRRRKAINKTPWKHNLMLRTDKSIVDYAIFRGERY
jgi:hypothetical protein